MLMPSYLAATQYYDLPTLSLRSAAYHLMDAGLPKFQASSTC